MHGTEFFLEIAPGYIAFLISSGVRLGLGYFVLATTVLKTPIGTDVGDYRLESAVQTAWLFWWSIHRLSEIRSDPGPKLRTATLASARVLGMEPSDRRIEKPEDKIASGPRRMTKKWDLVCTFMRHSIDLFLQVSRILTGIVLYPI